MLNSGDLRNYKQAYSLPSKSYNLVGESDMKFKYTSKYIDQIVMSVVPQL